MVKRCPNCKNDLTDTTECVTGIERPPEYTCSKPPALVCKTCGWSANQITGEMRRNFRKARRLTVDYLKDRRMISTRSNLNIMTDKEEFSIGFVNAVVRGLEANGIIKVAKGIDDRTWIILIKDLPPEEPRTKMVNISVTTDICNDMAFGFLAPLALTESEVEEIRDLIGEFIDEISEDYENSDVDWTRMNL